MKARRKFFNVVIRTNDGCTYYYDDIYALNPEKASKFAAQNLANKYGYEYDAIVMNVATLARVSA